MGVAELVESMRATGYHDNEPLYCKQINGLWRVYDGNRRLAAIDILAAEGAEWGEFPIERVSADMDEADLLAIALRPGSLPLTPIEAAAQITKMRRFQLDDASIAQKTGRTVEWVQRHLRLNGAPAEIKTAVAEDVLSATEADHLIRHDPEPVATLEAAQEAARLSGSRKVRPRHIAAVRAPEVRLHPAEKAILRLLAVWDMLRVKPQVPQDLLVQIEALREVVP